jgi:hypothetical protein
MTGSWVQISKAATRISDVTGEPVSVDDVHRLGGDDGPLIVQWLHDHYGVLESSLAAYLTDLAACGGDNQTPGLSVRGGPELPLHIEDEYWREQST